MFEGALGSRHSVPRVEEPYRFKIGDTIEDRCVVRGYIGQGGMGHVLRVQHELSRMMCALKYCSEERFYRRFAREVRIMQSINSEHIIRIFYHNLDHDPPYFVMELGERSLQDDLRTLQGDEATVLKLFLQICAGVYALHANGIFHRDIKPANVIRMKDGRVVVSDLGLARFEARDTTVLTTTIQRIGTEEYLAPEQRRLDHASDGDARTDIYQMGKLLYQMITGCPPGWIDSKKLPPGLDYIIRRATSENPEGRYPMIKSVAEAVRAYRSSKDPQQNPREVLEHLVRRLEGAHPLRIPPPDEINQVLDALSYGCWLEHNLVIECFHRLPVSWLPAIAKDFDPVWYPILDAYATAIKERVRGYSFSYADDVCSRMRAVYDNSTSVPTKVLALRVLMTAADALGRFGPQAALCDYLQKVKTIDLALPIADMLVEHGTPSLKTFQRFNIQLYHPAIRRALESLEEGRDPELGADGSAPGLDDGEGDIPF